MKKLFLVLTVGCLVSVLLSACSSTVVISTEGSSSMERVIGALIEGYRQKNGDVTVNFSGTGSGAGIEAVLTGVCDIGLSSRVLKDSEIERGAVPHLVARDGIAIIVHLNNPVRDLSAEQLARIFTGEIVNWAQIGGRDAPIAVYGREAGSGTRGGFEAILDITDRCRYTNEYTSTGDIVGNISQNLNGIGYVSLSGVGDSVKALLIDGVPCCDATIRQGIYSLQRPFLMVTSALRPLSAEAQDFLDYALSGAVAEYIAIAGAVAP